MRQLPAIQPCWRGRHTQETKHLTGHLAQLEGPVIQQTQTDKGIAAASEDWRPSVIDGGASQLAKKKTNPMESRRTPSGPQLHNSAQHFCFPTENTRGCSGLRPEVEHTTPGEPQWTYLEGGRPTHQNDVTSIIVM